MDLSKVLSISGRGGLFKVVSQLKNAVLVESIVDKKRFPAFPHEKISSLEEIAVFTNTEDKPLKDILKVLHEKLEGKAAPDPKSDTRVLQDFFKEIVPDYNTERVYISDIRKILGWYNILVEHNLLDFTEKEEEKPEEQAEIEQPATDTSGNPTETESAGPKKKKSPAPKRNPEKPKEQ